MAAKLVVAKCIEFWREYPNQFDNGSEQSKVADALAKLGPSIANEKVVNALLVAIRDKKIVVRISVAEALGKLGPGIITKKVVNALLATMGDNDITVAACSINSLASFFRSGIRLMNLVSMESYDLYNVSQLAAELRVGE